MTKPESKSDTIDGRLSRLEAAVESLAGSVKDITDALRSRQSGVWTIVFSVLGLAISVGVIVGGFAAFALDTQNQKIAEAKEQRKELADRLERWIEREQERNNRIERELAAARAVDELFVAGRLNLGAAAK